VRDARLRALDAHFAAGRFTYEQYVAAVERLVC
jgi:hypothetical protein